MDHSRVSKIPLMPNKDQGSCKTKNKDHLMPITFACNFRVFLRSSKTLKSLY